MSIGPVDITWQGLIAFFVGAIAAAFGWGGLYQRLRSKQEALERDVKQVKDAAVVSDGHNAETHNVLFAKLDACGLQLNHLHAQNVEVAAEAKHTRQLLDSFVKRYEKRCDATDALTREHIRELRRYNDHVERGEGKGK